MPHLLTFIITDLRTVNYIMITNTLKKSMPILNIKHQCSTIVHCRDTTEIRAWCDPYQVFKHTSPADPRVPQQLTNRVYI
jgi:hypothetical protein